MLLAVFGGDVSKSLSPTIHRAAAQAVGLSLDYLAISAPSRADFLERFLALRTLGARGANVTAPFKAAAYALSERRTEAAEAMGAVNTLTMEKGVVEGDNTDGPGLVACLEGHDLSRVRVLGGGGAARAAVWAAQRAGAEKVELAVRDLRVRVEGAQTVRLDHGLFPTLVISTLPPQASGDALNAFSKSEHPTVIDLVYRSEGASELVKACQRAGLSAFDGRGLLAQQGARSFCRWTGAGLEDVLPAMQRVLAPHDRSNA